MFKAGAATAKKLKETHADNSSNTEEEFDLMKLLAGSSDSSKKEIAKALGVVTVEEHDKQVEKHNKQMEEHKEEHNKLKARVNNLAVLFQPAIDFALLETAVYAYVEEKEKTSPYAARWTDENMNHRLRYGVAYTCAAVLECLTLDGRADTDTATTISNWRGPNKQFVPKAARKD
ncbi:MAG: hypothetical protein SGILL_010183, partial [Bacillariaceae sp.]